MSEQFQLPPTSPDPQQPSLGRLVTNVVRDLQELLQIQLELAKSELKFSAKAVAFGAVSFILALIFLAMVVILGSITAAYLISLTGLHLAWSYMIVTGVYLLFVIIFVLFGIRKFKKVKPPTETIAAAKKVPEAFKSDDAPKPPADSSARA